MRILLDACVIYPTALREMLLGVAAHGLFTPLWSKKILDEWSFAAERNGIGAQAKIERLLLEDRWKAAMVPIVAQNRQDVLLPDPDDVHVLQAAITGHADVLLTANIKDFPTRVLSGFGIVRRDPDGFLCEFAHEHPQIVHDIISRAHDRSGKAMMTSRGFLKAEGLPKLGKWMANS